MMNFFFNPSFNGNHILRNMFSSIILCTIFPNDFSAGRAATPSLSITPSDFTLAFKKSCKAPTRWGGHMLSKQSHLLRFLVLGESEVLESLRFRVHFKILLYLNFIIFILITGNLWCIKYIFHSNLPQLPHKQSYELELLVDFFFYFIF